jgi:hypothetical protein
MTLPPSCAECLENWQPQPPGILRACPGPYTDCFTLLTLFKEGGGKCLQQQLLHCLLQSERCSQNGVMCVTYRYELTVSEEEINTIIIAALTAHHKWTFTSWFNMQTNVCYSETSCSHSDDTKLHCQNRMSVRIVCWACTLVGTDSHTSTSLSLLQNIQTTGVLYTRKCSIFWE